MIRENKEPNSFDVSEGSPVFNRFDLAMYIIQEHYSTIKNLDLDFKDLTPKTRNEIIIFLNKHLQKAPDFVTVRNLDIFQSDPLIKISSTTNFLTMIHWKKAKNPLSCLNAKDLTLHTSDLYFDSLALLDKVETLVMIPKKSYLIRENPSKIPKLPKLKSLKLDLNEHSYTHWDGVVPIHLDQVKYVTIEGNYESFSQSILFFIQKNAMPQLNSLTALIEVQFDIENLQKTLQKLQNLKMISNILITHNDKDQLRNFLCRDLRIGLTLVMTLNDKNNNRAFFSTLDLACNVHILYTGDLIILNRIE